MPVNINGSTGVTTPGLDSDNMPTSGGDPVVESGSNSDGEWTKWADGTQLCTKNTIVNLESLSSYDYHTFPIPFVSETSCSWSTQDASPGEFKVAMRTNVFLASTSTHWAFFHTQEANAGTDRRLDLSATGRWK